MAGALRKVSEDYNWTIKRADNDLRHNITSPGSPRPPPVASPSLSNLSASPWDQWDSDRLRWKFRTDYEELCEHLEHIYFILFGWVVALNYLRTEVSKNFISDPVRSVVNLYEERGNLARLGIHPTPESIWSLTVALYRFAAPFIVSLLSDIFGVYLRLHARLNSRLHAKTNFVEKEDATSVSRLAEHPVIVEPVKAPHVSDDMQTPVKDDPGSHTAPSLPSLSLLPDPKGRRKITQSLIRDETGPFSPHPESHDARSDTGLIKRDTSGPQPSPPESPKSASRRKSRRKEAKVVRMRHRTEDFFGMGNASGSVIAYDPGSLAL